MQIKCEVVDGWCVPDPVAEGDILYRKWDGMVVFFHSILRKFPGQLQQILDLPGSILLHQKPR